jgi:TonB-dependent SusC/RagA subfamily outer membrane receptor
MPVLIEYLLKVSIALAVVYLFYQLLLRRLTFYNWNRWYLVGYSLLCFVVPFLNITDFLFRHELEKVSFIQLVPVYNFQLTNPGFEWNQWTISIAVLLTGMLVMGVRILIQLLSLQRIKTKATLLNEGDVKLFHVNEQIVPFSFHNGIYINRQLHTDEELQEIIRHEFVHVKQKHSIDILLAELLCMLLWFHPAAWLIRKAIRQNLEFIADEQVLQDGVDKKQYQYLLLKVVGNNHYSIAPNFNFSSLKNRIIMMNQIKSARVQAIRFLFVLPLLAVLLLAFREVRQQENKPDFEQSAVLAIDTIPADNIESIRVNKNNNEKTITIVLKDGTKDTYNLNDQTEKAAFEKKYGKLENKVPPPLEVKIVPFDQAPPKVELNEKGFYVSIADNEGECIVIVKDKKKNIVEALKLTDWTKNEAAYEKKYGKIPPPPPPTVPDAPAAVSIVAPVATTAIVSEPVEISTTSTVSPVSEVVVTGYGTKSTVAPVVVEGKQIKGTVKLTSPVTPVEEVTVVGYATKKSTDAPVVVEGKQIKGTINSTSPASDVKEVTVAGYGKTATGAKIVFEGKSSANGSGVANGSPSTKTGNLRLPFAHGLNTDNVLYILDGEEIEYGKLSALDPNTIESVSVLKSEAAVKLYGSKGENGVIIITTKVKK